MTPTQAQYQAAAAFVGVVGEYNAPYYWVVNGRQDDEAFSHPESEVWDPHLPSKDAYMLLAKVHARVDWMTCGDAAELKIEHQISAFTAACDSGDADQLAEAAFLLSVAIWESAK